MGDKTYPTTREALYSYLLVVIAYLQLNKSRLLISANDITALLAIYGDPLTKDTYMYYYTLWADEANSRTDTVIHSLKSIEDEIEKLLSKIYNDIPASKWTDQDRDTMHRKTGLPNIKTDMKAPITEKCFATNTLLGGGQFQLHCSISNDKTLASLPDRADGVQVASRTDEPLTAEASGGETVSKVKYKPLTGANDGTTIDFYSKANFTVNKGSDQSGNYYQFYTRWFNSKHPELAGPWTGPYVLPIP
jgi:hypothetical protein